MSKKSAPYYCEKCGYEPADQTLFDNPDKPCPECPEPIKPPVAEKLETPWAFRAACLLKEPRVEWSALYFGVILDLGFGLYQRIDAMLFGVHAVEGKEHLVESFASNWAENGQPNDLIVTTIELGDLNVWMAHVERRELELDTLQVTHLGSLADALCAHGLCTRVELDS